MARLLADEDFDHRIAARLRVLGLTPPSKMKLTPPSMTAFHYTSGVSTWLRRSFQMSASGR